MKDKKEKVELYNDVYATLHLGLKTYVVELDQIRKINVKGKEKKVFILTEVL